MNGLSPFGGYAPLVATIAAIGTISGYIAAALIFGGDSSQAGALQLPASISLGAIFGAAVAVNGWKVPTAAAHLRMDRLSEAVAAIAAASPHVDAGAVAAMMDTPPGASSSSGSSG